MRLNSVGEQFLSSRAENITVEKHYAQQLMVLKLVSVSHDQIGFKNSGLTIESGGPRRFREVRETCSFHPATLSPLNSFMVPSYDKKKNNFTRIRFTSIKV